MSTEELAQIKSTLAEALRLPAADRAALLAGIDVRLRTEVERLLHLHGSAGDFMSTSLPSLFGLSNDGQSELTPGTELKQRYRVESVLASSGFATVYRAVDRTLADKPVVIKVLDRIYRSATLRAAFESEVRALSRIRHPNVVGISDTGDLPDGTPFLVLDFVPGISLREELRHGPMPPSRAVKLLRGLGQALSAAHKIGILHLDLKPENVILSEPGTTEEVVTLIDFGIARIKGATGLQLKAGSPHYMAPEQNEVPSVQCDVYALGRVAFEMLAGHIPADGSLTDQLPRTIKAALADAIRKAIEHDPSQRHQTVGEFIQKLGSEDESGHRSKGVPGSLWVAGLMILVAAIGLAVLAFVLRRPAARSSETIKPVPFVTTPGFDFWPTFSPDGRWLYYVAGMDGGHRIYKKAVEAGEPILMSHGEGSDEMPAVSPDGARIAFIRGYPLDAAIFVEDVQSGSETEVARARSFDSLVWSPDGRSLLVGVEPTDGAVKQLGYLNLDSRKWRNAFEHENTGANYGRPAFSPDGRRIALVSTKIRGSSELLIADLTPGLMIGELKVVGRHSDIIQGIQWTPDNRDLLYVTGLAASGELWRIPANGGTPTRMLAAAGRIGSISIPKQAWKLAYSVNLSDTNVWRLDLSRNRQTPIIAGTYDDEEAHLSPDGTALVFASSRTGDEQIWLSKPNGSEQRQITNFRSADAAEAFWTQDSKALLISVRSKELGQRFYRTPADRVALQELVQDGMAMSTSRDGRWVYFRTLRSGSWQIWRMDLEHPGHTEQVTESGAYHAVESKDGKWLYFTRRDEGEGVWRQPLPHGTAEKVLQQVSRRNLFALGKRGLYYVDKRDSDGRQALFYRRFSDGATSVSYIFDHQVFWGLDLAPDERSLLFSQYDVNNSDIMLINDLH